MAQKATSETSTKTARPSTTRLRLLVQAEALLQTEGLSGHSLRSLAKALDTSHRMLQYHFATKEGLILEVLETARGRSRTNVQTEIMGTRSITGLDLWQALLADQSGASLMYQGLGLALADPENFSSYATNTFDDWMAVATWWLDSQDYEGNTTARATIIVATFRGLFLDLVTVGDLDRVEAAFMEVSRLFGLSPKPRLAR